MTEPELVDVYRAVNERAAANILNADAADGTTVVTDHVVDLAAVADTIAYPRKRAEPNPNDDQPKTFTEATRATAEAMREHGFTRIVIDEVAFEMSPSAIGLTAELLTVDDEAQAWDRYFVGAIHHAPQLREKPLKEPIRVAARVADDMLTERRKRFPKAAP